MVEHRRGLAGRCGHDDGVPHGAGFGQRLHNLRDGRPLLADGAVNANQIVLGVVDDGVQQHGRLARLPVADNQLALAAANGIMASMALSPVAMGSRTPWRSMIAGSQPLDGQELVDAMGPLSSIG